MKSRDALTTAAVVLSLGWVAVFLWVALSRVTHPFELEWMGGAFVDHVCRILDGELLYVEPTADYVPFLYAPLYMYVSAGVSLITGEGFMPLRIVSITMTLATFVLLAWFVKRRTGSWSSGIIATGLYAGSYSFVDTWFDTARADSMFVFLALLVVVVLTQKRGTGSAIVAAALLVVAYLTKQTALLLAPPFACAVLVAHGWKRAAVFAGSFAAMWVASTQILDVIHDGWFSFYTWTMPRAHEYEFSELPQFGQDMLWVAPAVLAAIGMQLARLQEKDYRNLLADGAWGLGLVLAAMSSRLHIGGAINVLMPGYLATAALGGLAFAVDGRWRTPLRALVVFQLLVMLLDTQHYREQEQVRVWVPARMVPTAADREAGERLVTMLREADGEVLVPFHGYIARMAGKRSSAHAMALIDIERGGDPELWARLEAEFVESARARNAALVVLDDNPNDPKGRLVRLVYPGYVPGGRLLPADDPAFMPVVGLETRPVTLIRRAD